MFKFKFWEKMMKDSEETAMKRVVPVKH